MNTTTALKIGIPVLNRGDLLRTLLESIDIPARVLVLVNRIGDLDRSVTEALAAARSKDRRNFTCDVLYVEGNLGVAGSWNQILIHFGGDCLICNSDISFAPGFLRAAVETIDRNCDAAIHYLHAAACFYVGPQFTERVGWFDENIYPAYCEDQEIALRCMALDLRCYDVSALNGGGIVHEGSATIRSLVEPHRNYVAAAHSLNAEYLRQRWGVLPLPGGKPEKRLPFDDCSMTPRDWRLDLERRKTIVALCKRMTGHECPIVFAKAVG
jgi:GT2 family glycosyltransferase